MRRTIIVLLFLLAGLLVPLGSARNLPEQAPAGVSKEPENATDCGGAERIPVVVELFTSEGCPSCPPADALLVRLVKEQPVPSVELVALGEHVDYWNRLGWKDIYSSAAFSARQGDYARSFGIGSVYTPQMVIDGRVEFVGSDERRAREAITAAAQTPRLSIQLTRLENKSGEELNKIPLQIRIERMPALGAEKDPKVLLAVTEDELESNVTRGENSGRRLRHAAVVRSLKIIGKLDRHSAGDFVAEVVVRVQSKWKRQNLHALVLVQEKQTRRVLGAATIHLAGGESPLQ